MDSNTYKIKLNLYFTDIDKSSEDGLQEINKATKEALEKFNHFCSQHQIKVTDISPFNLKRIKQDLMKVSQLNF
jgi:hypothetical protein